MYRWIIIKVLYYRTVILLLWDRVVCCYNSNLEICRDQVLYDAMWSMLFVPNKCVPSFSSYSMLIMMVLGP